MQLEGLYGSTTMQLYSKETSKKIPRQPRKLTEQAECTCIEMNIKPALHEWKHPSRRADRLQFYIQLPQVQMD